MPKLAAKDRKKVAKAEAVTGGEFEAMPPGKYVAELAEVEPRVSEAGNAYWSVEFTSITGPDGTEYPGRQWYRLMLPVDKMPEDYKPGPKAKEQNPEKAWEKYQGLVNGRLKAFFEAFGYSVDSDTDEMIGERCVIRLSVSVQSRGKNAGKERNEVEDVYPLDSVDWADGITVEGGDPDEF